MLTPDELVDHIHDEVYLNPGLRVRLAEWLAGQLAEREQATVEECCRAVCWMCDEGIAARRDAEGNWWHDIAACDFPQLCRATDIHAHFAAKEQAP